MSWLYTLIFAGLLFSSQGTSFRGVWPSVTATPPPVVNTGRDETERFDQTYPLNADGKVSVSNVNGSIIVEAWDRNEIKLEYIKIADGPDALAAINVKIDARPDAFKTEVDLDNWKTQKGVGRINGKMQVNYHLMVPRGAVLNSIETVNGTINVSNFVNSTKVSAVNGTVNATNLQGTANLSTVNGSVNADFDRLDSTSQIQLSTVNGNVKLLIPSDASATINADSINGKITNDWGLPVKRGKYVGNDLFGKIGGGDARIKLDSVNGSLTLSHRDDGRNLSPATNLLPQKETDDNDLESVEKERVTAEKIDKEFAKAVKESQKESAAAVANVQREWTDIPPAIAKSTSDLIANSINESVQAINATEFKEKMKEMRLRQRDMIARVMDASFISGVPQIEQKDGSFAVKGIPKVTIDARECSVMVRGWDRSEVQYRVTQVAEPRVGKTPLRIATDHTESVVNIRVSNLDTNIAAGRFGADGVQVRMELYIPRKSNLKITAGGEIRLDGVSGDIDLSGNNESIDVRDADGRLQVSSSDGWIRVIGFQGDLAADTTAGAVDLEGDFTNLKAKTHEGPITLTLSEKVSAEIEATRPGIDVDGIALVRVSGDERQSRYRVGKGGKVFQLESEGTIRVRGAGTLRAAN